MDQERCKICGYKIPKEEELKFCPKCGAMVRQILREPNEIEAEIQRLDSLNLRSSPLLIMMRFITSITLRWCLGYPPAPSEVLEAHAKGIQEK